ncbi:MAG: hypothetical protein OXG25_03610 [Gammaproteobacteria bacterium]|nr:hypothetical protein [Gammaproteobacteria bacterium]
MKTKKSTFRRHDGKLPFNVSRIKEPLLKFGYNQQLEYARDGLYLFGPDRSDETMFNIRYGVIGTPDSVERFKTWLSTLQGFIDIPDEARPSGVTNSFHVAFPGFEQAFGVSWEFTQDVPILEIDAQELSRRIKIRNRYEAIKLSVDLFVDMLVSHQNREENPPNVWIVVVPEEVHRYGRPQSTVRKEDQEIGRITISRSQAHHVKDNPTLFGETDAEAKVYQYERNFRRQMKARLLDDRIVTQLIRDTTLTPSEFITEWGSPIRRLEDPATVAWNLSTAVYYKNGGRPWQLASVRPNVCYVGLAYKKTGPVDNDPYACCAAQMFLSSGDGIVFRGALGPWYSPDSKQFHLDKNNARDLIGMVVDEYAHKFGNPPNELFLHAQSEFTPDEWMGFKEGCSRQTQLTGVQIRSYSNNLKLYRPGKYPIIRGSVVSSGSGEVYLWTSGFVPRLGTYMGPETPNPIHVKVLKGNCSLKRVLKDVMALTKLNFNACQFSSRLPITIKYADAIGDVLLAAPINSEPRLPFKFYI